MSKQNVTLKEIAQKAEVSTTTVYRVLNHKGGYSEELEQKIMKIAQEEGYERNYLASSLRKCPMKIVLLFPKNEEINWRFYLQRVFEGFHDYLGKVENFNLELEEVYFSSKDGDTCSSYLKKFYQEYGGKIDVLVLYAVHFTQEDIQYLNRFIGAGTEIIVLDTLNVQCGGCCRIYPDDELAGRMAGQLMQSMAKGSGTVAIFSQPFEKGDVNAQNCRKVLEQQTVCGRRIVEKTFSLYGSHVESMVSFLQEIPDLTGIYSTSARNTATMIQALKQLGIRPSAVIGSELFEESYLALQDGLMDVVMDKRPYTMGRKAMEFAFSKAIQQVPLPQEYRIIPRIILQANSDFYYWKRDKQDGQSEGTGAE